MGLLGGAVAICGAAHGGATELIVWDLPAQRQVARAPTADACHLAPDGDGAHVTVNDPDGRATIYGADGAPRLRLPANAVAVGGGVAVTQQPIDGGIEYTFAPLDGGRPRVVRKQWSDAEPCVNGTPHPTSLTSGWIDSTTTLVYYTLTDASPPR